MSNTAKQAGEWYQEIATGLTALAMTVVFFAWLRRLEQHDKLKFDPHHSGKEHNMKTLMHICCAPCANMPIEVLRGDGFDVTGYWYNPNIHPFTEYRERRNCLRAYAQTIELPLLERDDYGLRPFVREVAEDIAGRCVKCYEMRLFDTARAAAEGGFDSFTSSLFISPYQNHELMREVAERAAAEYGVSFLYRDFRPYFREGQERARALEMYIQKYCGCVFSEQERYLKPKKIIP